MSQATQASWNEDYTGEDIIRDLRVAREKLMPQKATHAPGPDVILLTTEDYRKILSYVDVLRGHATAKNRPFSYIQITTVLGIPYEVLETRQDVVLRAAKLSSQGKTVCFLHPHDQVD